MAFVVIQHLDPTHKSIMSSLLKKYTTMEIAEISDGIKVEKNKVYLAPPDHNIAMIEDTMVPKNTAAISNLVMSM